MLFVTWQWKTTVYVIFLASCLGQELFRACERDYCYERYTRRQRYEREPSEELLNERNHSDERYRRIIDNQEYRFSKDTPRDSRIERIASAEAINRFDKRVEVLERFNERISSRDFRNNREEHRLDAGHERISREGENRLDSRDFRKEDKVVERLDESTREHVSNSDFTNRREERRSDAGQKRLSKQESQTRLDRRNSQYNRDFKNKREERRSGDGEESLSRQEPENRLDRRDSQNNREANGRFDEYNNDFRDNGEERRLIRENMSSLERVDGSRHERIISGRHFENNREEFRTNPKFEEGSYVNRLLDNSRRSEDIDELFDRRIREVIVSGVREIPREIGQRSESRRQTERTGTIIFRRVFDDQNIRRDISHRQNLLSDRRTANQEAISSRRSDKALQNRRIIQFEATGRSVSDRHYVPDTQNRNSKSQRESSEDRRAPVAQEREARIANEDAREHRNLRPENEHQIELNNRENEYVRQRVENNLKRRVDRTSLGNERQHIVQQAETRRFDEREMRTSSQNIQRLRLNTSDRNKPESERREPSRRNTNYDENRRLEERNVERRENYHQTHYRFAEKQLVERRNVLIVEPKATNFHYQNNRFTEEDNITKPTVLLWNGYSSLGQGLLFAYFVMKTCNGKADLRNQLQAKLRVALRIIGY